jgi:hypothetical protein
MGMDEVTVLVVGKVKVGKAEVGVAKEAGLAKVEVVMGKTKTPTQDKEVAQSGYFWCLCPILQWHHSSCRLGSGESIGLVHTIWATKI